MKKTLILALIAAFVAVLTLSCCGKMMEKAIEEAIEEEGGEDVDIDIGGMMGGKPPKNFPKDLIYPGAKSTGFVSGTTEEGSGGWGALESSASLSRIVKYYEGLESKGWTNEGSFEASTEEGESYMLTLSKGDFSAVVTISEDSESGKTIIGFMYGEE
ncbi:hypothetical protein JXM67_08125 [candidate division WOR-3 bacterium]|nr:hypothetical protein [candidate division WOR-3 bacterium]